MVGSRFESAGLMAGVAVNANCPISGHAIDATTRISWHGKSIGFCCPGCDGKFMAWSDEKKDEFIAKQANAAGH